MNPVDLTLLKSRRFGLITGLGFEFNNFRFENNIALKYEHGVTVPDFQYEEQRIRLQTKTCQMTLCGEQLHIDYYTEDEMKISGQIGEIRYC